MSENHYISIPILVAHDNRLTPMAKLLYGEIENLTHQDGVCWASNDYLAKIYNMHKKSISRNINELVAADYITIELTYKPGTKEVDKRIIKLSTPINENVNTYPQNCGGGIDENVPYPIHKIAEESNIIPSNNNISNRREEANTLPTSVDKYYEDNIGKLSNSVIKELGEWLTKVDDSLVKFAIDEAVKYGKPKWSYVRAVLKANYDKGRRYGSEVLVPIEEKKKETTEPKRKISADAVKRLAELGA